MTVFSAFTYQAVSHMPQNGRDHGRLLSEGDDHSHRVNAVDVAGGRLGAARRSAAARRLLRKIRALRKKMGTIAHQILRDARILRDKRRDRGRRPASDGLTTPVRSGIPLSQRHWVTG